MSFKFLAWSRIYRVRLLSASMIPLILIPNSVQRYKNFSRFANFVTEKVKFFDKKVQIKFGRNRQSESGRNYATEMQDVTARIFSPQETKGAADQICMEKKKEKSHRRLNLRLGCLLKEKR